MRPGTVSVSALDGFLLSTPGEVVSGIQAIYAIIKFQKEPPCRFVKESAGRFSIQEISMNTNVNDCSVIVLLRQLVEAGYCTQKEATRIAARIARQTGADINLPI